MPYNDDIMQELNVLNLFNLNTTQEGIKVHSSAKPELIEATQRLFNKGLISQNDGGYLTPLGHEAAESTQTLLTILITESRL
ncbi:MULTISPECIES: TIGR02647 family protein [unclassified Neptuniibacter]|uniref:TIGR02647 family protein n=1 Tax=unclassified Neptuniibacter TaxID=2630693 RepID=UPI000C5087EC|nr:MULTISPECIES: TIGR02647 family protein [unclassified Neptuniibacter]MAY42111.1 TIGR02647 family protein [Oceanospirillaceae bacterium]|tara:strand:+ start:3031 stop:3276 length:246 start_codon:yes stop_codon:yes gene_type:complete